MDWQYILFDLDGTLSDTGRGVKNSVRYALRKFGLDAGEKTLDLYIGPPLRGAFQEYAGLSESDAEKAVAYYREYYSEHGVLENEIYPGMEQLLSALSEAGKTLLVATSKPDVYTKIVIRQWHLEHYFAFIGAALLDGSRDSKADIIRYALDGCGCRDYNTAVMIGDRKYDILGAKSAGISAVGVTYGYGSESELRSAGALIIADSTEELKRILL